MNNLDEQGYAARNLSLSGVSKITGLHRLEVRELFIGTAASEGGAGSDSHKAEQPVGPISITVLTNEGELLSAGEAFSVDVGTGTFRAQRIGPHEVAGEVDFLRNSVRNAVLESPEIRQEERRRGGKIVLLFAKLAGYVRRIHRSLATSIRKFVGSSSDYAGLPLLVY